MFQRKQRRISEKIKSTLDSDALPFHEILDADMVESAMASEGVQSKDRIYTPFVTLCLFLSQVLDQDHSCRAAVMRLILWMALNDRKPCSSETTSYCDARQRLPLEVIVRLVHATAEKIEAGASDDWLWKGRRVSLVDGMTASMPDTPRNQQAFPQANTQGIGLGFPIVRMVAIISLATGVARDLALGPYKGKGTGEPALLRALLDGLAANEIVLGDRYFGSFFMLDDLMRRELDGLFRMYQGRKFDFRRGRRLGVEDHLVTWAKPKRPDWMDEETYAQIPDEITVRELRFKVEQPGFRVDSVVLVTTMLDETTYTKDELADLYLQRWNVELDLRSIKDVLQMDVLRCKSPEMVEKEIWMHLLAYNLIRGVMAQAAEAHEKRPRQLSFKGTLQTITAFQEAMRRAAPADREFLLQAMLRAIAQQVVGDRPGRVEPRANKRRPKAQRYLMEPRRAAQTLTRCGITANLVPFVSDILSRLALDGTQIADNGRQARHPPSGVSLFGCEVHVTRAPVRTPRSLYRRGVPGFRGQHTYLRRRLGVEIHVRNHQPGGIWSWLCARRFCQWSECAAYGGSGRECGSCRHAPEFQASLRLRCHRNAVTKLLLGQPFRQVAIRRTSLVPNVRLEPTPHLRRPDFESGASAIAVALETGCGGA